MSTAKRFPSEMPNRLVELSEDAQEALLAMIDYGLNNGIGMGMDEGFDLKTEKPHPFRKELEQLVENGHRPVFVGHFRPTPEDLKTICEKSAEAMLRSDKDLSGFSEA